MTSEKKRRLAAIMFTDIVGYARFMEEDEQHGRLLRIRHKEVFEACTKLHNGQVIQYFGDGTLSVFDSAVSAVECAVDMQKAFQKNPQVPLRIGIHLGDILYDDIEAFGHGVNVAARIEPVCNPGGVFISDKVYDEIKNQSNLKAKHLGSYQFKNIDRDIGIYAIQDSSIPFPDLDDQAMIQEISAKLQLASVADKTGTYKRYQNLKNRRRMRRMIPWVVSLLLLSTVIFAFNPLRKYISSYHTAPDDGMISIAVLPFVNMSGTEENEYFSDGMTEDILTLLSKLKGFSVTSRTSVMQYKDTEKTMPRIGRELGVEHLLEGSVRREGNRVKITAQLIDAKKDEHLWAKTYDQEVNSIFDIQSEVASDIAQHLKKNLSSEDIEFISAKPTENVTAYEDYLKGLEYYRKYSPKDNEKAIECFKKALDADPKYAVAYAGLGDAYAQKAFHKKMNPELLDSSIAMSRRAIEINPKLSEGHKSLGLAYHYLGETKEALKSYHKAVELNPYNDMASNNIGQIEIKNGNIIEGVKWAEHTLSVNKNVPTSVVNLAKIYYDIGDDEKASFIIDEGISGNPDLPELREMKGQVLLREGKYAEAKTQAEKLIKLKPGAPVGYTLMSDIFIHENKWEEAEDQINLALKNCSDKYPAQKMLAETLSAFVEFQKGEQNIAIEKWTKILEGIENLEEDKGGHVEGADVFKGSLYAAMGKDEEAMRYFKKAKDNNWLNYKDGMKHPMYKNLWKNKDFQILMNEIKLKSDSLRIKLKAGSP